MDFDLDPTVIGVTVVFYLIILVFLWKIKIMEGGWAIWQKITITVFSLPLVYIVVAKKLGD